MRLTSSFARLKHSQVEERGREERKREESSVSVIYLDFMESAYAMPIHRLIGRESQQQPSLLYRINYVNTS